MFNDDPVDTWSVMRYDVHPPEPPLLGAVGEEDLCFAAFSLSHAVCGDDVLEVRLGERALLAWCTACDVMRIFGPSEPRPGPVSPA
jgi:hypothetical protein